MKTNLKTANLKEEYAETILLQKAESEGILLEDDSKATAFSLQLKRKTSGLSPFTDYDVWIMEGVREENGRCEDCVLILCMTISFPPIVTEANNILKKSKHGQNFRFRDLILERRNKDGKDYFVAK